MTNKFFHICFIIIFSTLVCSIPVFFPNFLPVTPTQHILLGIFVVGALSWLLEPIPQYATSIFVIGALALLMSDSAISPIKNYLIETDKDHLLSYKSIFSSLSSPVIILFLGGFAIAMAATKYKIDENLARIFLKPFGNKPRAVTLGLMFIAGFFAMFMSNTATTMMMLATITPVIAVIDKHDPGIKALVLGIPFAANIGGISTPIGTPPNAIALSYIDNGISFLQWMCYGVPIAIIGIMITWFILLKFFPFKGNAIKINIESSISKDWKTLTVYATFLITVILWMTESLHGINSYVVAIIPLIVFLTTRILNADDIKNLSWDVIWLVAGGIALGDALSATGLASLFANLIDYSSFSAYGVIIVISMLGWTVSNFISSTAAANLMIPISIALIRNLDGVSNISIPTAIFTIAISFSFGMSLPISTPPNALAYATGHITGMDMFKTGLTIGILCLLLTFGLMFIIL